NSCNSLKEVAYRCQKKRMLLGTHGAALVSAQVGHDEHVRAIGTELEPRTLNLKVKYRESFRPFAPSVLREECLCGIQTMRQHQSTVPPAAQTLQRADRVYRMQNCNLVVVDCPAQIFEAYSCPIASKSSSLPMKQRNVSSGRAE